MAKNLEKSHFKANFFLGLKERIADDSKNRQGL